MRLQPFYIIAVAGLAVATAVQAQTMRDISRKEPAIPTIATVRRTLQDAQTPRPVKEEALLTLTKHGADAVPALLEFAHNVRSEKAWDRPVAVALNRVLDRRLLLTITTLAESSTDPEAQAQAIKTLAAFTCQTLIMVSRKNNTGGYSITGLGGDFNSNDDIFARGIKLTIEDRVAVRAVIGRIKDRKNLPDVVRRAVDRATDRIDRVFAAEQKRLSAIK